MKADIIKTFFVENEIDEVWHSFTTPEIVVECVPGAHLTEKIDATHFKGQVELKFGPMKAQYEGKIQFLELDKTNYKMVLEGDGTDSKGKGGAKLDLTAHLVKKDNGTHAEVEMIVNVQGMLAQFGSRLIKDATNQVFDQFISNLKATLSGQDVDRSIKTGAIIGSVVKGIFKK